MIRALLAILLLCGLAACSQREATPHDPDARPALWAIEDRDGAALGWLFGTIHALPDGTQWETPTLASVIENAGLLVVEVRDLDPQRTAAVFDRLARDEPVPPLAERLAPSARRELAELLARKDLAANSLDGLESWAAALALARLATTVSTANGVDQALIARFADRPVSELEGAEDQLAIFDSLPEGAQRRLLAAVLDEQKDTAVDARALAGAWSAGDLATLERITRRGLLADPALNKALSADRNTAWVEKLLPLLQAGQRPLVAVGTAHMLRQDGLPAVLAAKGFRVRRIQ